MSNLWPLPTVKGSTGNWGRELIDYLQKGQGWIDIRAFGAIADSETDCTAAIQAAIDAATTSGVGTGVVFIPSSAPSAYMFSNLTLPPAITIIGESMWHSVLRRITGSTGNAIQEDSTIKNAAKIQLYNFTIQGNDTAGCGINLGNENTDTPFGTEGYIDNVMVRDFTGIGGTGFNIYGNVCHIGRITAQNCTTVGVILSGVGNEIGRVEIVGLADEIPTGMKINGSYNIIKTLYLEGKFTLPVDIDGDFTVIETLEHSVGAGYTVTDLVEFDSGAMQNRINNIIMLGTGTITNVIDDKYNGVVAVKTGLMGSYDQGGGVTDYSIIYVDDADITIPANASIKIVVMDNLTVNRNVILPLLPSGYPVITVINNSDVGNLFKVNVNAHATDSSKKVAGRGQGFPLWAQSSITIKGVDTNIAADKGWERIGGQNNSLFTKQVEISSSEMKANAASPKELIPAPGANHLIEFVSAVLIYDSAATDYTVQADENMAIRYENGSGTIVSETVESDSFIKEAASDGIRIVHPLAAFQDTDVLGAINKSLVLDNVGSGEWDDGTGTMTVIITWREHYNLGL